MSIIIERFDKIKLNIDEIKPKKKVTIIAVSKTFSLDHIKPLLDYGHNHFGENKVQEALSKWKEEKNKKENLKLHMLESFKVTKLKVQSKYLTTFIP